MNLSETIAYITRRLDFNPNLQSWKDGLIEDINTVYLDICDQRDWLFLRKEGTVTLLADVEGLASTRTIEVASANLRRVICTGFTPGAGFAGQTITIDSVEYTIGAVIGQDLFLTSSLPSAVLAGSDNFTVRQDRVAMPRDCPSATRFISRADDQGMMTFISREEAALYGHDRSTGGDAYTLIDMFGFMVQAPEFPAAGSSSSGAGSLTVGDVWEFCYTFDWMGVESPPSEVIEVTVGSGHDTIDLSAFENTQWGGGVLFDSGKVKNVYARKRDGRWHLVVTLDAITTTHTFLGTEIDGHSEKDEAQNLFVEGPRQFIEPWHRVGTDKTIAVEYLRQPNAMKGDSDVPLIPTSFHNIIPYRVLSERLMDHGDDAGADRWGRRYEQRLNEMEARYMSRSAKRLVKKSFVPNMIGRTGYRVGTVTKVG